jgi:hypothetical protein
VAGNAYAMNTRKETMLLPTAHDRSEPPVLLSLSPADRDYMRLPADSPLGKAPDPPGYVGALPPGPAPKEGDWFMRLRDRWAAVTAK